MGFNRKSTNRGSDSGIQELDALLSMLSDTQPQPIGMMMRRMIMDGLVDWWMYDDE